MKIIHGKNCKSMNLHAVIDSIEAPMSLDHTQYQETTTPLQEVTAKSSSKSNVKLTGKLGKTSSSTVGLSSSSSVVRYKKPPQAPRRFKSAYMFFSTFKHKEMRSLGRGAKVGDFTSCEDILKLFLSSISASSLLDALC
jgi:hypothetical protein